MDKDTLKMLANKLMFTMDEREYDTLLDEFDTILKQMDLIGNIPNIESVSPMTFPFKNLLIKFEGFRVKNGEIYRAGK